MNNITKYSLIIAGFFIASFGLFWFLDSPTPQTVTQQSSPSTSKEACSRTLSEVSGDYYPATLETPAEYPEVEITAIYYKEVDVLELLEFDLERIYELVNEKL